LTLAGAPELQFRLDIVNWVVVLFETTRQFAAPVVPPGVTTAT
jgi:hypothetical protein